MKLLNAAFGVIFPPVPENLQGRITMAATCKLFPNEFEVLGCAFLCLSRYLQQVGDPYPNAHANIIFTDQDTVSLSIDPNDMGNYAPFVFYPLHKIHRNNYSDARVLAIALEELCHCFLMERDEIRVMHLVFAAARCCFPDLQFSDLYNTQAYQP